jgi:hypothetical protein
MNVSTLLPNRRAGSVDSAPESDDVLTVRPVRAAFGPHVSLVSVDSQGRLWMRFSTALVMLVAGLALMMIPMTAFWWVSSGLVDSGQVTLRNDTGTHSTLLPGQPQDGSTEPELPLADTDGKKDGQ